MEQQGNVVGLGQDGTAFAVPGERKAAGRVSGGNHDLVDRDAQLPGGLHRRRLAALFDNQGLGRDIPHVEGEFILAIGGVERRRGRAAGDGDEGGRHLRAVGQDDGDPVVAAQAEPVEGAHRAPGEGAQVAIGQ